MEFHPAVTIFMLHGLTANRCVLGGELCSTFCLGCRAVHGARIGTSYFATEVASWHELLYKMLANYLAADSSIQITTYVTKEASSQALTSPRFQI